MSEILTLTKRNIKNYYRDKTAVFFSFLSVIILLGVYILFLGNMYNDITFSTEILKTRFMIGYIMGGVLVVNTLTLSLGVIGTYVNDLETKKINGFLVTPIKRWKIIVSYYLSTFILTLILTLFMFLLVVLYLGINGYWYSFVNILEAIFTICLYVFISVPLVVMLVSFISSNNAFGALSSIVGTLIGFISGIYIPLSILDPVTNSLAAILPFSHMTIYLRRLLIGSDIINSLSADVMHSTSLNYIKFFGININIFLLFGIFLLLSFGFIVIAYIKMNKKAKK